MKELRFERRGRVIHIFEGNKANHYRYINEAKRASRILQYRNGGLGCGSLRVIK